MSAISQEERLELWGRMELYDADILKALLRAVPDGVVAIDASHRVILFNETARREMFQLFQRELEAGVDYRSYLQLLKQSATELDSMVRSIVEKAGMNPSIHRF